MEICPNCGYKEVNPNLKRPSAMNRYINKDSGLEAIIQRDEEEFLTTPENGPVQTWIRKDKYVAKLEVKPAQVVPPIQPTPPLK